MKEKLLAVWSKVTRPDPKIALAAVGAVIAVTAAAIVLAKLGEDEIVEEVPTDEPQVEPENN